MKYYTGTISNNLYNKLVVKGMPQLLETYAQVFDWLMSQGINIEITPQWDNIRFCFKEDEYLWRIFKGKYAYCGDDIEKDWLESAERAIEQALELGLKSARFVSDNLMVVFLILG